MRIAYVHYLPPNETAVNHVRQFAAAATSLGHELTVHAMHPSHAGDTNGGGRWRQTRAAVRRRLGRYLREPRELLRNAYYAREELRLLRATRPDVLLVRDHVLTASCVPVARRRGVPLVLEINAPVGEMRLYGDNQWHLPMVERLEAWKLRRAAMVTVVSVALRDHLVARHGIPAEKFIVVRNGADVERFRPNAARSGSDPVVGFVGSFQRWHGVQLLTEMMLAVARARPTVRFLLVGDGPEADAVRRMAAMLPGRVEWVGAVPHERVPELVARFDVGVLPDSCFYMSPLKVVEWMAAGKAVVAPGHGPLRELIDDGVHGVLFPAGDRDALVAAVLRLVDDANLRGRLGAAATLRVRGELTWRDNARKVLEACEYARRIEARTG